MKNLEQLAEDAYVSEMVTRMEQDDTAAREPFTPWDDLKEWQRESWRQEVDDTRDPDLIRQAAMSDEDMRNAQDLDA